VLHPRIVQPLELRRPYSPGGAELVPELAQRWLLEQASAQVEPVQVARQATPAWVRVWVQVPLSLSVLVR
jgi:hypothetical protein